MPACVPMQVLTGATQAVVEPGTMGHCAKAWAVMTDYQVLAMVVAGQVAATSLTIDHNEKNHSLRKHSTDCSMWCPYHKSEAVRL